MLIAEKEVEKGKFESLYENLKGEYRLVRQERAAGGGWREIEVNLTPQEAEKWLKMNNLVGKVEDEDLRPRLPL